MSKRERGKEKSKSGEKEKDVQAFLDAIVKEADAKLIKDMIKLVNRIERIFVPSSSIRYNPMTDKLADLMKVVQQGKYLEDINEFDKKEIYNVSSKNSEAILRKVNWKMFEDDLRNIASEGNPDYSLPREVIAEILTEIRLHEEKLEKARKKEKLRQLQVGITHIAILTFPIMMCLIIVPQQSTYLPWKMAQGAILCATIYSIR